MCAEQIFISQSISREPLYPSPCFFCRCFLIPCRLKLHYFPEQRFHLLLIYPGSIFHCLTHTQYKVTYEAFYISLGAPLRGTSAGHHDSYQPCCLIRNPQVSLLKATFQAQMNQFLHLTPSLFVCLCLRPTPSSAGVSAWLCTRSLLAS